MLIQPRLGLRNDSAVAVSCIKAGGAAAAAATLYICIYLWHYNLSRSAFGFRGRLLSQAGCEMMAYRQRGETDGQRWADQRRAAWMIEGGFVEKARDCVDSIHNKG